MVVLESSCLLRKKTSGLDFRKARTDRNTTCGNRSGKCKTQGGLATLAVGGAAPIDRHQHNSDYKKGRIVSIISKLLAAWTIKNDHLCEYLHYSSTTFELEETVLHMSV